MIETIYIESDLDGHPRARLALDRFPAARVIRCESYAEVFNPAAQSFRLQKQRPALILARKTGKLVLEAPDGFGIGDGPGFYFSHMLNCLFDCRYCFLQGMFRSAHYVLFVNFEDFESAIDATLADIGTGAAYFFSGYDCDSLALESISGFVDRFVPFFASRPTAVLELRTKSVAIRSVAAMQPAPNVIVAFSFTPEDAAAVVEQGAPPVIERVRAAAELAAAGWPIGIRLDPLLWYDGWRPGYAALVDTLAESIPASSVHSASLGPLRFPAEMFQRIRRMYPEDELLSGPLARRRSFVSYSETREAELVSAVEEQLAAAFPGVAVFSCVPSAA